MKRLEQIMPYIIIAILYVLVMIAVYRIDVLEKQVTARNSIIEDYEYEAKYLRRINKQLLVRYWKMNLKVTK